MHTHTRVCPPGRTFAQSYIGEFSYAVVSSGLIYDCFEVCLGMV